MTQFSFTVHGADVISEGAQEDLFEAGCDDATFVVVAGTQTCDFDREAADFAEAVSSAIKAIESAIPGARVAEMHREPDVAAAG